MGRDRSGGQVVKVRSFLPGPKVNIKSETRDMLLEMLHENRCGVTTRLSFIPVYHLDSYLNSPFAHE
jgi:hypothetical protein